MTGFSLGVATSIFFLEHFHVSYHAVFRVAKFHAQLCCLSLQVMCSLILRASVLPLEEKVHSSNTGFPKDAAHLPPQGHSLVTSAAKKARFVKTLSCKIA